ncbi:ADP-ribosylarginine hydrolase [Pristis pectinata]|uniref:ADP-ribosylarginine hydrolase n=1 Tax=Pristis pectinata TaxID=685728 RepID=UPI00223CAE56|nr:ADP-ribosylarginine hydrolase [Pristis pectinata]
MAAGAPSALTAMATCPEPGRCGGPLAPLMQRYVAAMVLSGAADALGYKGGAWEFCFSGPQIHDELRTAGGLRRLDVSGWMVSDDTVMHLATAEALAAAPGPEEPPETLYSRLARGYKESMEDMSGRGPGLTCVNSVRLLKPDLPGGWKIPFNPKGGGCGAAMRAMCVGLRYPHPHQLKQLIAVAVESGRMTHHHPTGYLGAVAAALFTAYAVNGKPVVSWGEGLMKVLEEAESYVKKSQHYSEENLAAWSYFKDHWNKYLQARGIQDGVSKPIFPERYGVAERDEFYASVSFDGWGGASGHDAPMIAYDAILGSGKSWEELCNRAVFHGGDSGFYWCYSSSLGGGALYGFHEVPVSNYQGLEYRSRLESVAEKLFYLSHSSSESEVVQKTCTKRSLSQC